MADAEHDDPKPALRQLAHAARAALSPQYRAQAAQAVARHFFEALPPAPGEVVAGYWRIRDELDCQPILVRLMDDGQPVVLPVANQADTPLDFRLWQADAPLYPAGFGTLAPADHAPRALPQLMLLPLLGFDSCGTRLGYGGGYYDRTLTALPERPRLVGLAFAAQELAEIPREVHDVPLDAVVTEDGARFFGAGA